MPISFEEEEDEVRELVKFFRKRGISPGDAMMVMIRTMVNQHLEFAQIADREEVRFALNRTLDMYFDMLMPSKSGTA